MWACTCTVPGAVCTISWIAEASWVTSHCIQYEHLYTCCASAPVLVPVRIKWNVNWIEMSKVHYIIESGSDLLFKWTIKLKCWNPHAVPRIFFLKSINTAHFVLTKWVKSENIESNEKKNDENTQAANESNNFCTFAFLLAEFVMRTTFLVRYLVLDIW